MDELIRIYKTELLALLNTTSFANVLFAVEAHEAFEDAHLARLAAKGITEAEFEAAYEAHLNSLVVAGSTVSFYVMPQVA